MAAIPGCIEWTPSVKIGRRFEETYTYEAPGTYEVAFTYGPLPPETVVVRVR